jgi:hypothetical protein
VRSSRRWYPERETPECFKLFSPVQFEAFLANDWFSIATRKRHAETAVSVFSYDCGVGDRVCQLMDAFATNDCCIGAAGADGGLAAGCRVAEAHLVLLGTGLDALAARAAATKLRMRRWRRRVGPGDILSERFEGSRDFQRSAFHLYKTSGPFC